ncbi:MAG: hypothetical protein EPO13_09430 [Actinomycetota bacterium]|nr:MAG: hypothetical protein EPO13_09430 [Actinomycetota bacterium]
MQQGTTAGRTDYSISIDESDAGSHFPPADAADSWQESWFLVWYDPVHAIGGYHHVSFRRVLGLADVTQWLARDGVVCQKLVQTGIPIPPGDLSEFSIGPAAVRTLDPLRAYALTCAGRSPDDIGLDLRYDAYAPLPVAYHLDRAGIQTGAGHYDSHGRVTGTARVGERTLRIDAFARHDHSWGNRDFGSLTGYRLVRVGLGPDLYVSASTIDSVRGHAEFGFVAEDGVVRQIAACRIEPRAGVAGSTGYDIRAWTEDGRGYRFDCDRLDVADEWVQGTRFIRAGFGTFASGGRMGGGMLEIGSVGTRHADSPELRH